MDIACVPMARGLVHLAAVPDWFSRKVLAWQVSITREAEFCIEALEEALARHGRPEILNTDQGSQFTSLDCVQVPKDAEIAISMNGKGAWRDKVFVDRLWRRVTYEEIDLHADANRRRRAPRLGATWPSTTARGHMRRLAGRRPIRRTSARRSQSRQRLDPDGNPLGHGSNPVQTIRAISVAPEPAATVRCVSGKAKSRPAP